jgi:hypothetical protein
VAEPRGSVQSRALRGEAISKRDVFPDRGLDTTLEDGAGFPDDSGLLMIGNTQELLDACKKAAEDARPPILAIYTKRQGQLTPLTVAYACIEVHWLSRQVDTLIATAQGRVCWATRWAPGRSTWSGGTAAQPTSLPPSGVSRTRFPISSDG